MVSWLTRCCTEPKSSEDTCTTFLNEHCGIALKEAVQDAIVPLKEALENKAEEQKQLKTQNAQLQDETAQLKQAVASEESKVEALTAQLKQAKSSAKATEETKRQEAKKAKVDAQEKKKQMEADAKAKDERHQKHIEAEESKVKALTETNLILSSEVLKARAGAEEERKKRMEADAFPSTEVANQRQPTIRTAIQRTGRKGPDCDCCLLGLGQLFLPKAVGTVLPDGEISQPDDLPT